MTATTSAADFDDGLTRRVDCPVQHFCAHNANGTHIVAKP